MNPTVYQYNYTEEKNEDMIEFFEKYLIESKETIDMSSTYQWMLKPSVTELMGKFIRKR